MPDVPALFNFSMLLRREDAHPSRRFFLYRCNPGKTAVRFA
ncbi:hypothetical protein [Rhizobium esperanzae]|uniref:Uncharacterized protein n=1 Tax=Rhizobium esperanzae TaxID=1967781 RepID=A0A7W6R6C2_9HYPH|nr:hypothetical protein [Rhizobium esperanzae]MBB4237489.1 hypothetical protein [Rhizobium esperanzae]